MKAVICARYSSDSQREESIEGQLRECTAFAEKNGITVLRHYIDRAFSARTDNRPEFQNMIKDSGKRLFDKVIRCCVKFQLFIKEIAINVIKKLCDSLDMTLGEFFSTPIFDELKQEIC